MVCHSITRLLSILNHEFTDFNYQHVSNLTSSETVKGHYKQTEQSKILSNVYLISNPYFVKRNKHCSINNVYITFTVNPLVIFFLYACTSCFFFFYPCNKKIKKQNKKVFFLPACDRITNVDNTVINLLSVFIVIKKLHIYRTHAHIHHTYTRK